MDSEFDRLVAEASAADVDGWDFGWLRGRATEERPPWGYSRVMAKRLAQAERALDLATGGGEVLNEAPTFPPVMVATESWPPNLSKAAELLAPRGVNVVAAHWPGPLPFDAETFDLVVARHPVGVRWSEISRVLTQGGHYVAQHVGPASAVEVTEWFLGPQPGAFGNRTPQAARDGATKAGLTVVNLLSRRLRMEFFDVGAVVYFLRKVIWIVPGFTVDDHVPALEAMHRHIQHRGSFVAHSARMLIETVKR